MTRRYIDPHVDPLRAPSRDGHHPHLVPEGPSRVNPQHMYEQRQQMQQAQYRQMTRPMGQAQPPAPQASLWDSPVLVFGLGMLAVWAGYKLAQGDQDPRRNPAPAAPPAPQPAPAQLVVMPGVLPTMPQAALPPATIAIEPAASAAGARTEKPPAITPAPIAVKEKRTRKTTQARRKREGPDGQPVGSYLPKGTSKKREEGKKT